MAIFRSDLIFILFKRLHVIVATTKMPIVVVSWYQNINEKSRMWMQSNTDDEVLFFFFKNHMYGFSIFKLNKNITP